MSQSVITRAFVEWKAQQAVNNEPVTLDEFVFANVPGLDFTRPIPDTDGMPDEKLIVYRQAVNKSGVVNQNAVVYSVTLGADVGDFDFNWIGIINRVTGTLAAITHAPTQRKIKNASGQQGNVLTRSILMEFSNAQKETEISVPAETWQIDFTARLAGVDERQRIENVDIYGPAAFFDDGFLVTRSASEYSITAGTGYVAGLRAVLPAPSRIAVSKKPVKVWVDVTWKGSVVSVWGVETVITVAETLADYTHNGQLHYVFAVAEIAADGAVTDLRPKGSHDSQQASTALAEHEKSRNHPDGTLTEKGFVSLSSSTDSDSETAAATPKAVKTAMDNADARYPQKGGVLNGSLDAKGDVSALSGNVCARANPDNKSGGAFIFQKVVSDKAIITGSVQSEADGGHLQINPTDADCLIRMNGRVVTRQVNNYRIIANKMGAFWRFDGGNYFLMFTDSGDPEGGWNNLRPFIANATNGNLTTGHDFRVDGNLSCGGSTTTGGAVYSGGGASHLATDGNLYGAVWGGYLNNWLAAQLNGRVTAFRLAGWGTASNGNNDSVFANAPDGSVVVGIQQKGNYAAVNYRYPQIFVNGNWINVGVA